MNEREEILTGLDNVTIPKYISGIIGGRTLDTDGFEEKVIKAGHVVIVKDGNYKPMPVKGDAYDTLPEGYAYCGVVAASIKTSKPSASIMHNGEVNIKCVPYNMDAILEAFKKAVPHITFVQAD